VNSATGTTGAPGFYLTEGDREFGPVLEIPRGDFGKYKKISIVNPDSSKTVIQPKEYTLTILGRNYGIRLDYRGRSFAWDKKVALEIPYNMARYIDGSKDTPNLDLRSTKEIEDIQRNFPKYDELLLYTSEGVGLPINEVLSNISRYEGKTFL
jgi:hypothetical protein